MLIVSRNTQSFMAYLLRIRAPTTALLKNRDQNQKTNQNSGTNQKNFRTPWDHLSNIPWAVPCESENFTWDMSHVESFVKVLLEFLHP